MQKSEIQTLLDAFESVRNLSKFYLSKLDKEKIHFQLESNGTKFNSAYWLVTHLIWTERYLIIQGIGGKNHKKHWLDEYAMGTDPGQIITKPEFDELIKLFDEVHAQSVEIIKSMKDEELDEPNHTKLTFDGESDKRALLKHAIRHEPMHIGQISWILKVTQPESTP